MQKRMSFIARITLLLVLLMTTALHCEAVPQAPGAAAQKPHEQSENQRGNKNGELGKSSETTRLLAQNQRPQAAAPDKSQGSAEGLDLMTRSYAMCSGPYSAECRATIFIRYWLSSTTRRRPTTPRFETSCGPFSINTTPSAFITNSCRSPPIRTMDQLLLISRWMPRPQTRRK